MSAAWATLFSTTRKTSWVDEMTQIIEMVAVNIPASEESEKCPFKLECKSADEEGENIADDDLQSVQIIQENNGGTLGKNLESGSQGAKGTTNDFYKVDGAKPEERVDTKTTGEKIQIKPVEGFADKGQGLYPFGVAAHHVVPGNAALKKSDLYDYMVKGKSVTDKTGKSFTIKENIGYNINGAHNGVWLVGNYAIRSATSPNGKTWSLLTADPGAQNWCINYVAAAVKKTSAQFHDVHVEYSEKVMAALNAISVGLRKHQTFCEDCKSKTEVPPPYRVKLRLYNISRNLKGRLMVSNPSHWKLPWVTSDKWKAEILNPTSSFKKAYEEANP